MHNIFTREHNFICDELKSQHPDWSDQRLHDTARLIVSALIAMIHVVEWTPTILNNDFVRESVKVEWFGTLSRNAIMWLIQNNITFNKGAIHANIGLPKSLSGVPFSITEEFVAMYRFHPLLPDDFNIYSMETGKPTGNTYKLPDVAFGNAQKVFDQNDLHDIVYTFGTENPGAPVLHNYPVTTTDLVIPRHQGGGALVDLATIDVIRDRERGIPRYNQFRRLLGLRPLTDFNQFDVTPEDVNELRSIYNDDIESVDVMIGCLAEHKPDGFGFGETPFQLFLLMANRRMVVDRFFTDDFKPEFYTQWGIDWVNKQTMKDVLLRAFPDADKLTEKMASARTAFFDWNAT
ncbi:predicted protein [Nematostella vectensis]|uniref:Peroxidase n=1 Tax=Nematostella vectensis TaxID=45351 RepID=A7SML0_NEMVE|nr:predicted protein [Nematostella vectensis]|eukprot:XP_001627136.1 predicted protein [Nematostella vectensis]